MPDVVKIAMERRAELMAEVERLDSFIRTAEALTRFAPMHGLRAVEPDLPQSSRS